MRRLAMAIPRDAQGPFEVPPELWTVPGIQRESGLEAAADREAPLHYFFTPVAKARFLKGLLPVLWFRIPSLALRLWRGRRSASVRPARAKFPGSPAELTAALKAEAERLGLKAGVAKYDPLYVFSEFRGYYRFGTVVPLIHEQRHAETNTLPSWKAENEAMAAYARLARRGFKLARWLRGRGYRVQFHDPMLGDAIYQRFAVEAGLGQMGGNGQLLVPDFGSRLRLMLLTTDAPLVPDGPVDYGIPGLCAKCQVCIQRCPARALGREVVEYRGVWKYKTATERCFPLVLNYKGCAVCMKVCPIQRFGLRPVLEHYKKTGQILGKGTADLEFYELPGKGAFGPGELPTWRPEEFHVKGWHGPPTKPVAKRDNGGRTG
jgi:ferredoxin